jgi:hypothetical protein
MREREREREREGGGGGGREGERGARRRVNFDSLPFWIFSRDDNNKREKRDLRVCFLMFFVSKSKTISIMCV